MSERRLAAVLATYRAVAPPGILPDAFAAAALADTYEVLADLEGVVAGLAAGDEAADLLWPGSIPLPATGGVDAVLAAAAGRFDQVVLVPADAPDLPGLVLAKVFRALFRSPVALAPERDGSGCVALGVRLPLPTWWPTDLDLDLDPYARLVGCAPQHHTVARTPDWHRLRTPAAVRRLEPGLEGWEQTRALLSGHRLGAASGSSP